MADIGSQGEIDYWVDIIIHLAPNSIDQLEAIQKIPSYIFPQVYEAVSKYYDSLKDPKHQDKEIKEEYKDDSKYGIDTIKSESLEEADIKLGEDGAGIVDGIRQVTPYVRGKDMEEHHAAYEGVSDENLEELNKYKRDTGSANQSDILPHLFKRQSFYKGISDHLDKTIAVAKVGFSQAFLMTRTRKRASGSMFRSMADTNFESELQPIDKTVSASAVVAKLMPKPNPFRGKFTFHTSYGPPPTASLSQSQESYVAQIDLGVPQYGSSYTLYNTTTGSLSSGSLISANNEIQKDGEILQTSTATTESLFSIKLNKPTTITYTAKWEQNITSQSIASSSVDVSYSYRAYYPSILNGKVNPLYPTKKTVLQNGTIVIT
jgi:hypothetical protein